MEADSKTSFGVFHTDPFIFTDQIRGVEELEDGLEQKVDVNHEHTSILDSVNEPSGQIILGPI